MTDDKIALRELLEKGSDASFLREMIGFAAERLMALETDNICGAALANVRPNAAINGMAIVTATGRRAPAPSSCASQSCARAAISPASSNPVAWPRRR